MPYIKSVSATNLKGRTFRHEFTDRTYITGPNFSGKTSIAEAVRVALLGHIPELGKKGSATFELSSAGTMGVALTLSDGNIVERLFTKKGSSVSEEASANAANFVTPLLNAGAYFELTERERIDYVFARVEMPQDKTPAGIIAQLERTTFGEQHSEDVETAKAEVISKVKVDFERTESTAEALTLLTKDKTGTLPAEYTDTNRRVESMKGATQALAELKHQAHAASATTLTDLRNDVSRLQGLTAEASQELGRLHEQVSQAAKKKQRKAEIESALAAKPPAPRAMPEPPDTSEKQKLSARQQELRATLAGPPQPNPQKLDKLRADYSAASERLSSAGMAISKTKNELSGASNLKECPHCGSDHEGWNDRIRETIQANLTELEKAEAAAAKECSRLKSEGQIERETFDKAARLYAGYEEALLEDRTIASKLSQLAESEASHGRMMETVETSNRREKESFENRLADLRKELETIEALMPPTESELDAAEQKAVTLRTQWNDAQDRLVAGERLQRDLQLAEEAAAQYRIAKAKLDVIQKFKEELLEIKGDLVASAFRELLKTANAIVGRLLPSPLVFDAPTNEVGRIGKTGFISNRTFSGAEKMLGYVGIAAALAAKSQLRVPIIDEFARLTPELQADTLHALSVAVTDGLLDQVIIICPCDDPTEFDDTEIKQSGYSIITTKGAK